MRSDRYTPMFDLAARGERGVFVPFWMLGDPTPERSLDAIEVLIDAGADALELGIPFADPIADGPVIQAAARRALGAGTTLPRALELVAAVRVRHPRLPIGLLAYANLVTYAGPRRFYAHAAAVGADSVLIADVPSVEAAPYVAAARAVGVAPVLIAPPDAAPSTLDTVAREARGYVYIPGRAGVTGTHAAMRAPSSGLFTSLRARGAPPALIGFGISTPEHVRAARVAGAAGVIVGSALVHLTAEHANDAPALRRALGRRAGELRAAA